MTHLEPPPPPQAAFKHRGGPGEPALARGIRRSIVFSGVAVAATGVAVSSGMVVSNGLPAEEASAALSGGKADHQALQQEPQRQAETQGRHRSEAASRSGSRNAIDPAKQAVLKQDSGGQVTRIADLTSSADPREIARGLLPQYGFSSSEFGCLDALWESESSWDPHADNPASSAYGIPQALTGGTHALPADYMTNPVTQIRWGLGYIQDSYGTPCSAWSFKQSHNWY